MSKQTSSLYRHFPYNPLDGSWEKAGEERRREYVDLSRRIFSTSIFNPILLFGKSHESNLIIITHHKAIFTFSNGKNDFSWLLLPLEVFYSFFVWIFMCHWNGDNKITSRIGCYGTDEPWHKRWNTILDYKNIFPSEFHLFMTFLLLLLPFRLPSVGTLFAANMQWRTITISFYRKNIPEA